MPNVGSERVARFLPGTLIRTRGNRSCARLYLTFDDGPHPAVTDELRELLAEYDAHASFFCIGENIERHAAVAGRLVDAGHAVCNHSHTHGNYRRMPGQDQLADAAACASTISELGGSDGHIFRAPQGQLSLGAVLRLRNDGYRIVHWSYDSMDYTKPAVADQLQRFVRRPVRNGDIVLFHDDSDLCISALKELLPQWRKQGFSFGRVTELI